MTWRLRQQAYVDDNQSLRLQITLLTDSQSHNQKYQELIELVQDSILIEQDLLNKYSLQMESEYQRQLQIVDKEVESLHQQKQHFIRLLKDYEEHYAEVTKEREVQVKELGELTVRLRARVEEESGHKVFIRKYEALVGDSKNQICAFLDQLKSQ